MGVFDTTAKVKRAVADPATDHTLPRSKSLSWKAITTPAALAGTTGSHCELVHGDKWRQIVGNVTENISENSSTSVTGDHSHSVIGNQNLSVLKNAAHTHVGPCTKTYIDNKIETYGKDRFISMSGNTDYQYYNTQFSGFGFEFQVAVVDVEIYGVYITIVTTPLLAAVLDAGIASHVTSKEVADQDESPSVGGGAWAGAAALALYPLEGLQIGLNSGFNLSVNYLNFGHNFLDCSGDTFRAKVAALEGRIHAGVANVRAAAASVAAQIGIPAHVPLLGSST